VFDRKTGDIVSVHHVTAAAGVELPDDAVLEARVLRTSGAEPTSQELGVIAHEGEVVDGTALRVGRLRADTLPIDNQGARSSLYFQAMKLGRDIHAGSSDCRRSLASSRGSAIQQRSDRGRVHRDIEGRLLQIEAVTS